LTTTDAPCASSFSESSSEKEGSGVSGLISSSMFDTCLPTTHVLLPDTYVLQKRCRMIEYDSDTEKLERMMTALGGGCNLEEGDGAKQVGPPSVMGQRESCDPTSETEVLGLAMLPEDTSYVEVLGEAVPPDECDACHYYVLYLRKSKTIRALLSFFAFGVD